MTIDVATYYQLLGVAPTATLDEIRRAYVQLARAHHPDVGGDAARMLELNEAWAVLGDPARRRTYDVSLGHRNGDRATTDDPEPMVVADEDLADFADPWPLAAPPARWMPMLPPLLFALSIVAGAIGLVVDDPGVLAFALVLFALSLVSVAAVTLLTLKSSVRSRRQGPSGPLSGK